MSGLREGVTTEGLKAPEEESFGDTVGNSKPTSSESGVPFPFPLLTCGLIMTYRTFATSSAFSSHGSVQRLARSPLTAILYSMHRNRSVAVNGSSRHILREGIIIVT
jgi:hypothetical protein